MNFVMFLKNYKKLFFNKFKYIYFKSIFIFSNLTLPLAIKLFLKLCYTEIKYFGAKLKVAKHQNFKFSRDIYDQSNKPYYYYGNYKFDMMDAFTPHVPIWEKFFIDNELSLKPLSYLEIGCFEGRSSIFVLEKLKNSRCTFVDPFEENYEMTNSTGQRDYKKIYKNFTSNISQFNDRYTVFRDTSDNFFKTLDDKLNFDLIYIDGSHFSDDVYRDSYNSFNHLNNGGYIIFDDFFWSWYEKLEDNPFFGICKFLKDNKRTIKILYLGDQLIVRKRQYR